MSWDMRLSSGSNIHELVILETRNLLVTAWHDAMQRNIQYPIELCMMPEAPDGLGMCSGKIHRCCVEVDP